jgi:D-glucosaminate-6-phosphate ammonia-lyase
MTVYEDLGVEPIINAAGNATVLGGSLMDPETVDAMREAASSFVLIDELQAAAGAVIAELTGAESGLVTAGAAAGLMMATAACVTGSDPVRIDRLPDCSGIPNEVVVPKGHRIGYDHAVRAVGVTLVEAGMPHETLPHEIERSLSDRTAAVLFVAWRATSSLSLADVVSVSHANGVPVIVDAAAELPPVENLRRFTALGADLVVFSGGKAIRGPQSSGILCGTRELIEGAALNQLDMHVDLRTWTPPPALINRSELRGRPDQGIGRALKVGKEEIVGAVVALRRYADRDHLADQRRWSEQVRVIVDGLSDVSSLTVTQLESDGEKGYPRCEIAMSSTNGGELAYRFIERLRSEHPRIFVRETHPADGRIEIHPVCLGTGEEQAIVKRIKAIAGAEAGP